MESWHLIVGLGNPGGQYARSRHNAGFQVVARLAARWGVAWTPEKKFRAVVARSERGASRVMLCQPQTFMNESGKAVAPLREFFRISLSNLLVVADDADLAFGELRLRRRGSSGGHHGLESLLHHLGSQEFARQKIGIGRRDPGVREITGHVLESFSRAEWAQIEKVSDRACDQIECWLDEGIDKAMNQFNGSAAAKP